MKVITKGVKFRVVCECCGALLEYSARDIDEYSTITCPECKNLIPHSKENKYES